MNKPIYVTQPTLPNFDKFTENLKKLWKNKHLTNSGKFHQESEQKLAEFLGVKCFFLFFKLTFNFTALITCLLSFICLLSPVEAKN